MIDEDIVDTAMSILNYELDRAQLAAKLREFNRCLGMEARQRIIEKHFPTKQVQRFRANTILDCDIYFDPQDLSAVDVYEQYSRENVRWPATGEQPKYQ